MSNNITFADLGLPQSLVDTVTELGYETPSPIQAQAIPELLTGRDILGMAQTGTGKTAAFALPVLANLPKQRAPAVLVLAPTRELAQQVAKAFSSYSKAQSCKVAAIYGGAGYRDQLRDLKQGADVVVGTPGRVMDHMRKGSLDVSQLQTLVLDEADEMLRMGFIDDVEWVMEQTPDTRQIALFSATMPKEVARIAKRFLQDPAEVKIEVKTTTATTIEQKMILVQARQKSALLTRVLEVENYDAVMVFVRTKLATSELADTLRAEGLSAEALNGDLSQDQREQTVARLKSGLIDIVVATDVAARGLDVPRISHVVNYDIPYDAEAYVHRIGRTGRAGRSGTAILFVQPREQRMLKTIERTTRSAIDTLPMPTVAQVNEARQQRLTQRIQKRLSSDLSVYEQAIQQLQEQTGEDPATIAAAILADQSAGKPFLLDARQELQSVSKDARQSKNQRKGREDRRGDGKRSSRSGASSSTAVEANMERFRIEVGRSHGVQPKNIVGAIANEAGVESENIGRIELYDQFSLVDLPEGMPKAIFNHLKGVHVCQQRLSISKAKPGEFESSERKPKRFDKSNKSRKPAAKKGKHKKRAPKKSAD